MKPSDEQINIYENNFLPIDFLRKGRLQIIYYHLFFQYWYWFPLAHFLSLAFSPSCVIGLNENLDMPVMGVKSNAKPSTYGYPAPLEEKKKEDKEKVATAVLSITAKQKKKEAEKRWVILDKDL